MPLQAVPALQPGCHDCSWVLWRPDGLGLPANIVCGWIGRNLAVELLLQPQSIVPPRDRLHLLGELGPRARGPSGSSRHVLPQQAADGVSLRANEVVSCSEEVLKSVCCLHISC